MVFKWPIKTFQTTILQPNISNIRLLRPTKDFSILEERKNGNLNEVRRDRDREP